MTSVTVMPCTPALQGFPNGVELVGLDDGGYEMQHVDPPQLGTGSGEPVEARTVPPSDGSAVITSGA